MKMQDTMAIQWPGQLPAILARVFAGRLVNPGQESTGEAEALGIPDSRPTCDEDTKAAPKRFNGHFAKRPEIMVPVDFSAGSEDAVDYAIEVARRARARLVLLHAVYLNLTPYGPANPAWLRSALCREALQKMEAFMSRAQQRNVPTISVIEAGDPSRVVAEAAKRWNVDLIVMASRKRNAWARFFGRQILEKTAREAVCPVMVIHAAAKGAEL